MSLEWLIIGGGIHGVHIAARLIGEANVAPERLRIVDPGERLLQRWRSCTETTGMTHLRSPVVHHIDLEPWALENFAIELDRQEPDAFAPPYQRPSLALFNEHCDRVIETYGLAALHIRGRAEACVVRCEGVSVSLDDGEHIEADRVVLAIGASDQPAWPTWAPREHARVHHIFAPDFDAWPSRGEEVAVIGGGISAGQVALRLVARGHLVHFVSRHALRQHQFDSDPGWLGPKYMQGFEQDRDHCRRREVITEARHRGSAPPDVCDALRRAIARERLVWHGGEITSMEEAPDGALSLCFSRGTSLEVDRVLLATGFEPARPGGAMVDALVASASLPCARCGYPIVDGALQWHPRVHVSGPLAELELGPAARNIAGARRAADRLVDVALGRGAVSASSR